MNKRIIFPTANSNVYGMPTVEGGVIVLIPASECGLTIEEIAAKDVPEGRPFKIIDIADVPSDRTFRNAWEYTE